MSELTIATRRRFLEASAGAAVTTWLASLGHAGPPGRVPSEGAARVLGTLPFVGEGPFPVDQTVGDGLGRRRALDLSSLSPEALVVPGEKFFIRTGCPDPLPSDDLLEGSWCTGSSQSRRRSAWKS